ncbi:MAG: metalloregulator ArsR/SmtB family transcription factor [Gammaproteobacteria bacterium]|jgi:ArsR family transcriptional regulator
MSNYEINNPQAISEACKALANPNRVQIFLQLLRCCEPGTVCDTNEISRCCVGELGEDLDIAASTLSHHIKELARAGLINTQRRGQHVECWVNRDMVAGLADFFRLDQHIT